MKIQLFTELPFWFILICLAFAFLVTWFLYRKDKAYEDIARWKVWIMASLRFLFIFFLAFLLLSPLFKSIVKKVEKPIIVFAQDNSESIVYNTDSSYYKNTYPKELSKFLDRLKTNYQVNTYSFDNKINDDFKLDFTGKSTNYSSLLEEISNRYTNRNVGAFILSGDGIYNEGSSPLNKASEMHFPIYTIALGDTIVHTDLCISELNYNKFAFLGNNFPLQIYLEANDAKGKQIHLSVLRNNKVVKTEIVDIENNSFSKQLNLEIEADKTGLQHYSVRLKALKSELNAINNKRDIMIDVIDSKQKVLILANSPHPDVTAIKQSLASNINYKVDFYLINDFKGDVKDYNLVIFHQLPSNYNAATDIIAEMNKLEIPCMYVVGSLTSIDKLNALHTGLEIQQNNESFEDVQAIGNKQFSLFDFDDDQNKIISRFPPLFAPFGTFSISPKASVFQFQSIRGIETSKPLILFNVVGNQKIAVIAGEGIWQWRIQDYMQSGNHKLFKEMINKIVQYLSLRVKKSRFIVNVDNVFNETETVLFRAEVYNKSYEPVNEEEIQLSIIDKSKKVYKFTFNKFEDAYRFDAGAFPVGDYNYIAETRYDDKVHKVKGSFSVLPIDIEAVNTQANHHLLYRLANENKGKEFLPSQWDDLYNSLISNQNIVPVETKEEKLMELINLKWVFFILLSFISLEWFFRRYNGGY